MTRRIAVPRAIGFVLLAALVVVAVAAADSTDPKTKLTKADEAHAKASLLRFSDLGAAWSGAAEKPTSFKIPVCPGNQPNDSDLTLTGHAESYLQLTSEGLLVDTDVEVFKRPGQVNTLFKRMMNPLLSSCLEYDLEKSVGGSGAKIGSISKLALKPAGTHSSDYRVAVKYNGAPVVSDYLFVAQGRTQFFVNVVAPGSLSGQLLSLENRIAQLLAGRAAKT